MSGNPLKSNPFSIKRLFNACRYSWAGFRAAWCQEAAFRQEVLLGFILIPLAFWLGNSKIEQVLLIGGVFFVWMAELLNSAIEAIADRVTQEQHPLIKYAKDLGSAAVFVALCYTVCVWVMIVFL